MRFPGLVDAHVHLRTPGGEHKENFRTGSAAALAGGFTTLLAMPNTQPPLVTYQEWRNAQTRANNESLCDVFLMAGASTDHISDLPVLAKNAKALKVYLNDTYGPLRVDGIEPLRRIVQAWPASKPMAVHAEGDLVATVIDLAAQYQQRVHICHVSRQFEIELIADARVRGVDVTCEVTPHHLFLTEADAERLGPVGDMRPRLASQTDVDALWQHINTTIDCIASDHAPHTLMEKGVVSAAEIQNSSGERRHEDEGQSAAELQKNTVPPGVPGLESTLPLLLTAAAEGRLSYERILQLVHTNPRRIYNLPEQPDTWIEIDEHASYIFPDHPLYTMCGWSPFDGHRMTGRLTNVYFKGREVFRDGTVLSY